MTPLRLQMIEDMKSAGLAGATQGLAAAIRIAMPEMLYKRDAQSGLFLGLHSLAIRCASAISSGII